MKFHNKFAAVFLVILVASVLGCASTATREGTEEYIDNTIITTKVKAVIFEDSSIESSEIKVKSFKGVVHLSGFVSSQAEIDKAVRLVRQIKGVKSVTNDLQLK